MRRPSARWTDPATSHEAPAGLDLTDIQQNIVDVFTDLGELTDEELVARYQGRYGSTGPSTIRTRRRELQDAGIVEVCGRSTTEGGRPCQVFRLTQSTLFPVS